MVRRGLYKKNKVEMGFGIENARKPVSGCHMPWENHLSPLGSRDRGVVVKRLVSPRAPWSSLRFV